MLMEILESVRLSNPSDEVKVPPQVVWRYIVDDPPRAEEPGYDDSGWQTDMGVLGNTAWDVVWFRAKWTVPVLLDGARITFRPAMGGTWQLYVNGAPVAMEGDHAVLTEQAAAGDQMSFALRVGDGALSHEAPGVGFFFSRRIDEVTRYREALSFVEKMRDFDEENREKYEGVLVRYLDTVDMEAYRRGDAQNFLDSLRRADALLKEIVPITKLYTLHIVPHSHIDLAWGWDYAETKRLTSSAFAESVRIMDNHPEYTFAQDQPPIYEHLEGTALFDRIKEYVRKGRWGVAGAMYTEPECNIPCGESLLRQLLYGKRYFKERFDIDVRSCWNLDIFSGHCWTLPQILKKSGIDVYFFARGYQMPSDVEFWWQGPDGSRVLGYRFICHYDSAQMMVHDKIIYNFFGYARNSRLKDFMYLDGDDLTPPLESSVEQLKSLRELSGFPNVQFSTPTAFIKTALNKIQNLPVFDGEFRPSDNKGSYSTHTDVKGRNRASETLLLTAERFGALASLYGQPYPKADLDRGWKGVLFNQMHDILPGTAIQKAYEDTHQLYDEADSVGRKTIAASVGALSAQIDTRGEGIPVVVFNPLSWTRTDVAKLRLTMPHSYRKGIAVRDASGQEVPGQVIGTDLGTVDKTNRNWNILFLAEGIPALGYKVFYLHFADTRNRAKEPMANSDGTQMENDFFVLKINPDSGGITSLLDKSTGKEYIPEGKESNLLEVLEDQGDPWHLKYTGKSWILDRADKVEVIENGPGRAIVRIEKAFRNTRYQQELTLYRRIPRVDCTVRIESNDVHLLTKVALPLDLPQAETTYEIPYGAIVRPDDGEYPAQRWVDRSGAGCGVSLLNRGRYGYDFAGGKLRLTLLRTPIGHKFDRSTDAGVRETAYSIYPHEGDWRQGGTVRAGYEFNYPLTAFADIPHKGALPPSGTSFLNVGPVGVVLTALKRAEDSGDMVLRICETHGAACTAKVQLFREIAEAEEIDFMEWVKIGDVKSTGNQIEVPLGPWEIKAVRFRLK